jgi:hypothetical protein
LGIAIRISMAALAVLALIAGCTGRAVTASTTSGLRGRPACNEQCQKARVNKVATILEERKR